MLSEQRCILRQTFQRLAAEATAITEHEKSRLVRAGKWSVP